MTLTKERKNLRSTIQGIIKCTPSELEKAQIKVAEVDELYQGFRVENALTDERGETMKLKEGTEVDVCDKS